ncbi:hypothetical protein [Streptomyces sp. NPDC019507]|uniref:hypothetical protein n=1 Tax=Streptomyces sp. NPDC019507 TaxID=3154689 RepID=UPI0033CDFB11
MLLWSMGAATMVTVALHIAVALASPEEADPLEQVFQYPAGDPGTGSEGGTP